MARSKKTLRVALTGLNAQESPGPGLAVLRCLKEASPDIEILGLAYDALEPAIYNEEYCQNVFMIPYPSAGEDAYLDRLKVIHSRFPIDVIIPTLDAELPIYISAIDTLAELGIKTYLPDLETFSQRSKSTLSALAQEYDFKVPETRTIYEVGQLPSLMDDFGYPLYIKGCYYDAYKVNSPAEAVNYFHKIQSKWGLPVLIQKVIGGVEYDAVVVGDGEGGHFGMVPMRKTYVTDKGKAWAGISVKDEKLWGFCEHVIRATKWRGPMEIEVMRDSEGDFYLIEINPRFPAWVYLSQGCGINMPWQVVQLALGNRVEVPEKYEVGMQFLRCAIDYVYPLKPFEELSMHGEIIREKKK